MLVSSYSHNSPDSQLLIGNSLFGNHRKRVLSEGPYSENAHTQTHILDVLYVCAHCTNVRTISILIIIAIIRHYYLYACMYRLVLTSYF